MPLPEHAPAASPISGYAVMSWHWLVCAVRCVPGRGRRPARGRRCRRWLGSAKMRGSADDARLCGARVAPGSPRCGRAPCRGPPPVGAEQPSSSSAGRTRLVPGHVDVDVRRVAGSGRACACASRGTSAPPRPAAGCRRSLMSKIRTPRNRSALTVPRHALHPQSSRPRVSSTDMTSRSPWTETSPWPPGQTTANARSLFAKLSAPPVSTSLSSGADLIGMPNGAFGS
jgi:hypothetical protein